MDPTNNIAPLSTKYEFPDGFIPPASANKYQNIANAARKCFDDLTTNHSRAKCLLGGGFVVLNVLRFGKFIFSASTAIFNRSIAITLITATILFIKLILDTRKLDHKENDFHSHRLELKYEILNKLAIELPKVWEGFEIEEVTTTAPYSLGTLQNSEESDTLHQSDSNSYTSLIIRPGDRREEFSNRLNAWIDNFRFIHRFEEIQNAAESFAIFRHNLIGESTLSTSMQNEINGFYRIADTVAPVIQKINSLTEKILNKTDESIEITDLVSIKDRAVRTLEHAYRFHPESTNKYCTTAT